jgi:DNA polymerase III sliding clamp (beta) subunit (PCNA family)
MTNKFTVNRSAFIAAARAVAAIAPASPFRAAQAAIRIASDAGKLLLSHDGNCFISVEIEAPCDGFEAVAVEARPLVEAAEAMDGDFSIEATGSCLIVSSSRRRVNVPLLEMGEVPVGSWEGADDSAEVSGSWLRNSIDSASAVVKTSDGSRYSAKGMLIGGDGGGLFIAATDSRRLYTCRRQQACPTRSAIVPHESMQHLGRLLARFDESVSIRFGPSFFVFEIGTTVYMCRALEGSFPPWKDVIPQKSDRIASVPAKEWRDAMRAILPGASHEKDHQVAHITFGNSEIALESMSGSGRSARATVDVDGATPCGPIGLRIQYAIDAAGVFGEGMMDVRSEHVGTERFPVKPLVFSGGDSTVVVMPAAIG